MMNYLYQKKPRVVKKKSFLQFIAPLDIRLNENAVTFHAQFMLTLSQQQVNNNEIKFWVFFFLFFSVVSWWMKFPA